MRVHAWPPGGLVFAHDFDGCRARDFVDAAVEVRLQEQVVSPFLMQQVGFLRAPLLGIDDAGSSSNSTITCSHRSSACARVGAIASATMSPTKRTLSGQRRVGDTLYPGMADRVTIGLTLDVHRAEHVFSQSGGFLMRIKPCAIGLRTKARCLPGQRDVANEAAATIEMASVLLPPDASADTSRSRHRDRLLQSRDRLRGMVAPKARRNACLRVLSRVRQRREGCDFGATECVEPVLGDPEPGVRGCP